MKMSWINVSTVVLAMLAAALSGGCDREPSAGGPAEGQQQQQQPNRGMTRGAVPETPTPATGGPRVVFLGDSITAGYGLDADQAFPALVGGLLADEGLPVTVVNAGVSGDTTAGGLRRVDWLLRQKPDVLVVGLGGNDGLRGLEPRASEENLRSIVGEARDAGASVLLLGMLIPPNYGPEYTKEFREIYPRLARDLGVPLVPFVLEGVGGDPRLNQPDGIHPTADGHKRVARNVLPYLRDLLRAGSTTAPATAPAD